MPATATSSASSCSSPRTVCKEHDKVDGEPPAKRRREEAVTPSSTVWFSDGNIVLIADHKSAFRVHRSVLAHHSSILKATLELAQPEDGSGGTYDGCPVLHVPDPAFDLTCLLRALYDGAKFQANRLGARPPFPVVAALVELSHKYDMGHLREEALRRFRLCLPHRFSDFISRVDIVSQQQSQGDGDTFGPTLQSPALHISADRDAIRTANLVRLVDDNRMLPMALYLCAQLSVTALLDGTEGDDGRMHTLCREDQARCLQARMVLSERNHRKMARIWGLSVARSCCPHPKKCHSIYRSQAKEELPEMVSSTPPNPLSSVEPRLRASGLCDARISHLLEEEKKEMLMIWEKLPGDLGLSVPQWDCAPPT